jgi:hypothetical protein
MIMPFFPSEERQRICPSQPDGMAVAKPVLMSELLWRTTVVSSNA